MMQIQKYCIFRLLLGSNATSSWCVQSVQGSGLQVQPSRSRTLHPGRVLGREADSRGAIPCQTLQLRGKIETII